MATRKRKRSVSPRRGGVRVSVSNSGLEVWLYDAANRAAIRDAGPAEEGCGGMPPRFERSTAAGLIVGFSLRQDDDLDVEVHVGAPFSAEELATGRWLEPQTAWLRLPSGELRVESNDASEVGPEEPGAEGVSVTVPAGDYRLTLYRVDHEALDREGLTWAGAQEIVLLTPGGSREEAAQDLLPFQARRDLDWVGRYRVSGARAEALAWFGDYWDTFFINLDAAALVALDLTPGRYYRVHSPCTGHTFIGVFDDSWELAGQRPPPDGLPLDEYGYAAPCRPQDWGGAETLLCRRVNTTTRVEDAQQTQWLPVSVEVLDADDHPPRAAVQGFSTIDFSVQQPFDDGFLALVLSDVLKGVDDLEELPLMDALGRCDRELGALGYTPLGDCGWSHDDGVEQTRYGLRFYGGATDAATVLVGPGSFEVVFLTEDADGRWRVTGLADELERRFRAAAPRVQVTNLDEPLKKMQAAHRKASKGQDPVAPPSDLASAQAAFRRWFGVGD